MANEEKYVQVQNLAGHIVVYKIPEDNVKRIFGPDEVKTISYSELQKLHYQAGGAVLLQNFLAIKDKAVAEEFGVPTDLYEHEYSWTQEDVDRVLTKGSLDELHDALDFAPEGIIDLIIKRAIELRIPDINKRELIQECTGHNINNMIATAVTLEQEFKTEQTKEQPKSRRVQETKTETQASGRRA